MAVGFGDPEAEGWLGPWGQDISLAESSSSVAHWVTLLLLLLETKGLTAGTGFG